MKLLLLAACAALAAASDMPIQVHLAYAGSVPGTGMAVSWETQNATATSTVMYGLSPTNLTWTATGIQTSYYITIQHHTVLGGLQPGTTYYYRCGDAAAGWSSVFHFVTARPAGAEFPLNVLVFGDMGIWNSNYTFNYLPNITQQADFMLQIGDISYADDAFLHDLVAEHYEQTWDSYMNDMAPYSSSLPWMVLPGNHEAECHSPICFLDSTLRESFANFSAYNHRFRMPSPESSGTLNMWFSFQFGSILFINMDTETDYPNAPNDDYSSQNGNFGNQVAWLQATLAQAKADRAAGKVSWIIVSGHRPIYSMNEIDASGAPSGGAQVMQQNFEQMFQDAGVDLYFSGHVHASETQLPVFNVTNIWPNYTNPPYTTYVVSGAGGCDEGLTDYGNVTQPAWNRYVNGQDYGVTMMRILDKDTMVVEFHRSADGSLADSFTLTRQH